MISLLFAPPTPVAQDSVAVLTLDAKGGSINVKLLKQTLGDILTEELIKAPVLGDSFNNLTALFGCDQKDISCLIQISKSLKVRFVIYGSATFNKTSKDIKIDFGLYDSQVDKDISRITGTLTGPEDKVALQGLVNQLLTNSIAAPLRKKKLTKNEVPLALQTQDNVVEEIHDPRRWLVVPAGLGASALLIGAITLPTGLKIAQAKRVDPTLPGSAEIQAQAGLQRQKFQALSLTGDILLGSAILISPLAIYQYRKEQKALQQKKAAPTPIVVAPVVAPTPAPVPEPIPAPASAPTKGGKGTKTTKTTKPKPN